MTLEHQRHFLNSSQYVTLQCGRDGRSLSTPHTACSIYNHQRQMFEVISSTDLHFNSAITEHKSCMFSAYERPTDDGMLPV